MNLDRYVGIPFLDKGRTFEGCDCWGLLRLVYWHERGVQLPSFCERYQTDADRAAVAALIADELTPWQELQPGREQPFDGVLMQDRGSAHHIGMVADRSGRLLHVEHGRSSVIVSYRNGLISHRVLGFYRHRTHE
jgi:cell wall-associated NlpC family hydrolase